MIYFREIFYINEIDITIFILMKYIFNYILKLFQYSSNSNKILLKL